MSQDYHQVFKQFLIGGENNHISDIVTDGEGLTGKILMKVIHKSETCGLGGDKSVLVTCLTGRLTLLPYHSSGSIMIGSVS